MAISVNHDMDQGSNFLFSVTAKGATGMPLDLSSGYTAYSQMRKYPSSKNAVTLNTSITGGTGTIYVFLSATGTAAVKEGTWFYDVELVHSGGTQRLVQGMITVYPEVTRI
jgi:hypothetical protein